jgi:hypothetical protein
MRVIGATFAGFVALATYSVQAAPLPPVKASAIELGCRPADRAGAGRLRARLAPNWLARPIGTLALE